MSESTFDTIVIGTGIGGLGGGLAVARRGHRVLLLEAGKQFGGMLNPFARKRFHFDVGLHYVGEAGPGQTLRRLLDGLGLDGVRFREIDPDCIDRYVFDGYEARLVKGLDRWIANLQADFPHERHNLDRFADLMRACQVLGRLSQGRRPGWRDLAHLARRGPDLLRTLRLPFSSLLEGSFRDPVLRAVFAGPGGDLGLPPSRASALASIMVLTHFLAGAYYPVGGSGAMRDAFVDALQDRDATLLRNRTVTRIEALGRRRFAVHTSRGERFESRSVISNVDAGQTFSMLAAAPPRWSVGKRARALRPSLGALCVFVGTDLDPRRFGLSDANVWHYGTHDLDAGYADAFAGRFSERPFFFLTVPTLKDPESVRAPAGHHTVELITFVPTAPFQPWFDRPVTRRGSAYEALKEELAARLLAQAERYLPGLRQRAVVLESATPATVWHFVRGRDGGIYGPEHSPDQMFHRRLMPFTGVPGLYLAGASVFGAGILTCLLSGVVAGRSCAKSLAATGPLRLALGAPRPKRPSARVEAKAA